MRKRKLIKDVDYVLLSDVRDRIKKSGQYKLVPGVDTVDKNSWKDVNEWCEDHNLKPADIFDYVTGKFKRRTKSETIRVGILIYDQKQLNKKKKKSIRQTERAIILHCRKEITEIYKGKRMSDDQLYRVGKKALERTPGFLMFDKAWRKKIGY